MSRALDFANDISTLESKFSGDTLSNVVIDAGQILGTDIDTLENAGPYIPVNITNPTDTQILAFDNGVLVNQDQIEATSSNVDHDLLTNFVANEHIDWTNATENFSTSGTLGVGSNALVVDSSGNVGIGTSSPQTKLDVTGSVTADGSLTVSDGTSAQLILDDTGQTDDWSLKAQSNYLGHFYGTKFYQEFTNNGDVYFFDEAGTTPKFFFDASSGNVGIGTISPPVGLSIQGTTSDAVSVQLRQNAAGGRDYRITSRDDGSLRFNDDTAGLERIRIAYNGAVHIAKTSDDLTSPGFSVSKDQNTTNGMSLIKGGGGWGTAFFVGRTSGAGTGSCIEFWYNGSTTGNILTDATTISWAPNSDYRLKENITGITDGISRVKQLNPCRFNFIADPDKTVDGFIAHEVQPIVPESVFGEKDAVKEDGSIQAQGLDVTKLVPLLTAALKEAIGLIDSQQSQIDALTARVKALESN